MVCDFGAAPPQAATSSPAIGGMTPSKPPTRRRHAAKELRMAQNPHRHRSGGCRIAYKNGTVSVGATKLAQQQPRRAASVQNSPCSPEMAQFGAIYACGASFVPLSPPRTQAGRILYRTQGRVGASHDTTTGTTSAEGTGATTGTRRMTGGRLAGPASVGKTTARQISHIIPHGHFSRPHENVAIPTIQI